MASGDHLGPALQRVTPDDAAGLRALFAEQRARLDVVRANGIWQWFGGVPSGFGSPKAVLHGIYLQFTFVGLVALGLVVAGFTRGPVLWAIAALAAACVLVRQLLVGPPTQATLRLYERAEQWPAVVVAFERALADPDDDESRCVAALVARGVADPDALQRLVAAGDRLRRFVDRIEPAPPEFAAFVETVQRGIATRDHDGSRLVVPEGLADGAFELARVRLPRVYLPGAALTSRLLFVFADPERRAAGHTRVVQSSLWGEGAPGLCAAFPLEVPA